LNSRKKIISDPNHAWTVSQEDSGQTIAIEEEGIEFGEEVRVF